MYLLKITKIRKYENTKKRKQNKNKEKAKSFFHCVSTNSGNGKANAFIEGDPLFFNHTINKIDHEKSPAKISTAINVNCGT